MCRSFAIIEIRTEDDEFAQKLLRMAAEHNHLMNMKVMRKHYRLDLKDFDTEPMSGIELMNEVKEIGITIVPL